jgi:hypothetical protein
MLANGILLGKIQKTRGFRQLWPQHAFEFRPWLGCNARMRNRRRGNSAFLSSG